MNTLFKHLVFIIFVSGLSWINHSFDTHNILPPSDETGLVNLSNPELPSVQDSPIATFLTFQNNDAEEAMNFYVGLFENSRIIDVQKYGKEGPAPEGSIMVATFELNGNRFKCSDSFVKHEWDFTPGVSIWVDCKSDEEIEGLYAQLSENGKALMPLGNYGFSTKFAFIEDRFGVSWQINLK